MAVRGRYLRRVCFGVGVGVGVGFWLEVCGGRIVSAKPRTSLRNCLYTKRPKQIAPLRAMTKRLMLMVRRRRLALSALAFSAFSLKGSPQLRQEGASGEFPWPQT